MILKALLKGLRRVAASPGLIVWLWLVSVAVALPFAWMMMDSLRTSIGGSLVGDRLTESFDMGWYGEYEADAKGLEKTFTPTVAGAGAFYNNLEAWLYGDVFRMVPSLVGTGILYILIWALFLGGVIERCSGSGGSFSLSRFFSTGGKFFFRFVRLAVLSAILYYLVFRLAASLFQWVEESTVDVAVEETVFLETVLAAVVVAFLLTLINMCFDYAKIAAVKEDRRSMILAAFRGIGFVFSHPLRTFGVYYALVVLGAVLLAVYASVAPEAGPSTTTGMVWAFLLGQVALIVKQMLRLWFYAGQTALFESVTAAPVEATAPSAASE